MDDLISRQAAIDSIRETSPAFFSAYQHNTYVNKQEVMIRLMALPSVQPERKNGKKFIEIVVTHLVTCPYPEYKGKPYFSIRYEENGEQFEGFGTYNPEVLAQYIREYFMSEKKGKWIDARDHCGEFLCSNCHETNINNSYKYCPHCGADMMEEEDGGNS